MYVKGQRSFKVVNDLEKVEYDLTEDAVASVLCSPWLELFAFNTVKFPMLYSHAFPLLVYINIVVLFLFWLDFVPFLLVIVLQAMFFLMFFNIVVLYSTSVLKALFRQFELLLLALLLLVHTLALCTVFNWDRRSITTIGPFVILGATVTLDAQMKFDVTNRITVRFVVVAFLCK